MTLQVIKNTFRKNTSLVLSRINISFKWKFKLYYRLFCDRQIFIFYTDHSATWYRIYRILYKKLSRYVVLLDIFDDFVLFYLNNEKMINK